MDRTGPVASARRSARPHVQTGSTVEFETLPACNLVMDVKTGRRPDGDTCKACWDACYKKDGFHGHHAVVGPDEAPCPACQRHSRGSPYSAAVAFAHVKLNYLEASRAAGNR